MFLVIVVAGSKNRLIHFSSISPSFDFFLPLFFGRAQVTPLAREHNIAELPFVRVAEEPVTF
jgi:hypothetical protein